MKKRIIFPMFLISLIGFICSSQTSQSPNIIIMMADDLGYGDLGCFGNQIIETPNIDQLARDGAKFTQFYSGHYTCSPSRAGMMTGRTTIQVTNILLRKETASTHSTWKERTKPTNRSTSRAVRVFG